MNITQFTYSDTNFERSFDVDSDHDFIITSLNDIAGHSTPPEQHFFGLSQHALGYIKALKEHLNRAHDQIAAQNIAIKTLEKLATIDPLTGLMNRRGFITAMQQEFDRTNRQIVSGGLIILIDLDNFQSIFDLYGHQVANEALELVSQTLTSHIRTMDIAAYLGRDEFILIFSNANPTETSARLQKMVRKLNSLLLKHQDNAIKIRASIGVQAYKKGDNFQNIMQKLNLTAYNVKEETEMTV